MAVAVMIVCIESHLLGNERGDQIFRIRRRSEIVEKTL